MTFCYYLSLPLEVFHKPNDIFEDCFWKLFQNCVSLLWADYDRLQAVLDTRSFRRRRNSTLHAFMNLLLEVVIFQLDKSIIQVGKIAHEEDANDESCLKGICCEFNVIFR